MAAIGRQIAVASASPSQVTFGRYAIITNQDATNSVFLGGSGVTATGGGAPGYELKPGQSIGFDASVDDVYAICAATKTARVDTVSYRRTLG